VAAPAQRAPTTIASYMSPPTLLESCKQKKCWQVTGNLDCKNGKCYFRTRRRPNSLQTPLMNSRGAYPVIFLNSLEKWAWS